jgi:hypothetical protein
MAIYTVIGHPLNPADLDVTDQAQNAIYAALWDNGVGQPVTLVLAAPDNAEVEGHSCLA